MARQRPTTFPAAIWFFGEFAVRVALALIESAGSGRDVELI